MDLQIVHCKIGASKVFAIDVGYNQLAWKLRQDERVINMEKQNIRAVTAEQLGKLVDFISIDVAFISLDKVLPVATTLLKKYRLISSSHQASV